MAEEIEEVEVSYTAACVVREQDKTAEKLAIFFHSKIQKDDELLFLLQKLRQQVVSRIGVNPDYLIPVVREAIPKTAIGKIQRLQLSQRFEAGEFSPILKQLTTLSSNNTLMDGQASKGRTAPQNDLESQLVSIWQEVLEVPQVGIQDNFFELGGDSIKAMMLVNRLQEELSKILHPVALFDAPTIEKLSDYLKENYSELIEGTPAKVAEIPLEKLNPQKIIQMRKYLLHHLSGASIQSSVVY